MAQNLTQAQAQDEWTDRQIAEHDHLMMLAEEGKARDAEARADYCDTYADYCDTYNDKETNA